MLLLLALPRVSVDPAQPTRELEGTDGTPCESPNPRYCTKHMTKIVVCRLRATRLACEVCFFCSRRIPLSPWGAGNRGASSRSSAVSATPSLSGQRGGRADGRHGRGGATRETQGASPARLPRGGEATALAVRSRCAARGPWGFTHLNRIGPRAKMATEKH